MAVPVLPASPTEEMLVPSFELPSAATAALARADFQAHRVAAVNRRSSRVASPFEKLLPPSLAMPLSIAEHLWQRRRQRSAVTPLPPSGDRPHTPPAAGSAVPLSAPPPPAAVSRQTPPPAAQTGMASPSIPASTSPPPPPMPPAMPDSAAKPLRPSSGAPAPTARPARKLTVVRLAPAPKQRSVSPPFTGYGSFEPWK
jgi:hypothetical protein